MNQRGSALLIVVWVILIVSIISLGIGYQLEMDTALTQEFKDESKARDAARSLLWWAVFQLQTDEDEVDSRDEFQFDQTNWQTDLGDIKGTLTIEDEGSRMNLNTASSALLKELFERLAISDALNPLLDWRDPDDQSLDGGTEISQYDDNDPSIQIRNGFLPVPQEFRRIKGGDEAWNKLKDQVTVWGPVNLSVMDKDVLFNILREVGMEIDVSDPIMNKFEQMRKAKMIKTLDDLEKVDSRINTELIDKLRPYIVTDGTFNPNFITEDNFRAVLALWKIEVPNDQPIENDFKDKDSFASYLTTMKPNLSAQEIWSYFTLETKVWRIHTSIKTGLRVLSVEAVIQRDREEAGSRWKIKILNYSEHWRSDKEENNEPTDNRPESQP